MHPTSPAPLRAAPKPACKPGDDDGIMPLVALPLLLSFFIVVSVTLVCLRQPLKPWLPWIGGIGFGTGCFLFWRSLQRSRVVFGAMVTVALVTTWIVLALRTREILPIPTMSAHMDSWCYSAVAEYLTDYARGTVGGLGVTDQWSSHLSNTRFPSPCLLALGRLLGDPIDAQTCVLWFVLIANVGAMAAFMRACGLKLSVALGGAAFAVIAGWQGTAAITIGNFDNLIFIAESCGAIAILLAWTRSQISSRVFIGAFALQVASMIMTYPEGTALFGTLCLPWAVYLVVKFRPPRGRLGTIVGAITLGLVLSSTYWPVIRDFVGLQLSLSAKPPGNRPGDHNLDGLLTSRFLGAAFSSGEEYPDAPFSLAGTMWALLLIAACVDGIRRLKHTFAWYPWIALTFFLLLLWQGGKARYEYGVYKIIFCACWWIFTAIAVSISERLGPRWSLVAFALGISSTAALQYSSSNHRVWQQTTPTVAFKELCQLKPWLEERAVVISLTNNFQQMWATLMLRGIPLALEKPTGSLDMPHVRALVAQAAPLPSDRPIVRLDQPGLQGELLHSKHFGLYAGRRAFFSSITNPNGIERMDGLPFLWVAHHAPTVFLVDAPQAGQYRLVTSNVIFGPSISQGAYRDLEISNGKTTIVERIKTHSFSLPIILKAGLSEVNLRCTNPPENIKQANGDTRELLIGLSNLRIEAVPDEGKSYR